MNMKDCTKPFNRKFERAAMLASMRLSAMSYRDLIAADSIAAGCLPFSDRCSHAESAVERAISYRRMANKMEADCR